MNKRIVVVLASLFLLPQLLSAQTPSANPHDAQPERPTVATHAGTVAPGWLEVESGIEVDRFSDHSHGVSFPTVSKFGVAPRVQLSVQTPVLNPPSEDTTGFGDLTIGMKWRIVDGAPVVGDFAILPSIKTPTGSETSGTGTGTTDFSLLLISSHQFGPVDMDINGGYTRRSGDGSTARATRRSGRRLLGGQCTDVSDGMRKSMGIPAPQGRRVLLRSLRFSVVLPSRYESFLLSTRDTSDQLRGRSLVECTRGSSTISDTSDHPAS